MKRRKAKPPVTPAATTAPRVRQKAQRLTSEHETQIWLLASPAEADQLVQGVVPLDIQQQAKVALEYIVKQIGTEADREK